MNKDKNFYESKSLVLASTLVCLGISLQSVIKDEDNKSIFIFPKTEELDQLLDGFWKRTLLVEPNSFFEAQRFLKSRIYGG